MPKKLELTCDNGSITIRGVDNNFSCKYSTQVVSAQDTVSVKTSDDTLKVEFKKPKGSAFRSARADFELDLPKNCTVKIKLGNGSVTIRSIDGHIDISAGAGKVKAYDLNNDIACNIGSGRCALSFKDSSANAPKKCKIKGGSLNAQVQLPAGFCVKNKLKGPLFTVKVNNAFDRCKKHPDVVISGGIGTGSLDIEKK